jgi:hypothetical protein
MSPLVSTQTREGSEVNSCTGEHQDLKSGGFNVHAQFIKRLKQNKRLKECSSEAIPKVQPEIKFYVQSLVLCSFIREITEYCNVCLPEASVSPPDGQMP